MEVVPFGYAVFVNLKDTNDSSMSPDASVVGQMKWFAEPYAAGFGPDIPDFVSSHDGIEWFPLNVETFGIFIFWGEFSNSRGWMLSLPPDGMTTPCLPNIVACW